MFLAHTGVPWLLFFNFGAFLKFEQNPEIQDGGSDPSYFRCANGNMWFGETRLFVVLQFPVLPLSEQA